MHWPSLQAFGWLVWSIRQFLQEWKRILTATLKVCLTDLILDICKNCPCTQHSFLQLLTTADAALGVAVGGAAGCFLGTDVSYGAANWMGNAIGIQESFSPPLASTFAGT